MTNPQAVPTYFGAADEPLFGWFHASAGGPEVGLVLCGPFGREELSAHRSLRELANTAAEAGWPVLRFDLACSGDSAGDTLADDLPARWLASVHSAIDELRRLGGVQRVALVGVRLGALLAWQAALTREDLAGLACIAPVLNGRAWLRELKALEAASHPDAEATPIGVFEAGGFEMSEVARDALSAIDLRRAAPLPAAPMLVIDRGELPALERWVADLAAVGASICYRALPGYADMMLDPHRAEPPRAMWAEVLDWVRGLPSRPTAEYKHQAPVARRSVCWDGVREEAVTFDVPGGSLDAIVSTSVRGARSGCTLVLLNAGATRRIGPSRIYVDLARRWARRGHRVVRLDVSGLGDSAALPRQADNVVYSPSAVQEVCRVVEQLRADPSMGREVHLLGLCSGAYHGFKAAVSAARVDSVVAINPLTFYWHEGMSLDAPMAAHKVALDMTRYRRGVFVSERWRKLFGGGVDLRRVFGVLWLAGKAAATNPWRELARILHLPLTDDLAAEVRAVTRRGARLKFLIAEGDPGEILLRSQAGRTVDVLARAGLLKIQRFEGADHVFSRRRARLQLIEVLDGMFPGVPPR